MLPPHHAAQAARYCQQGYWRAEPVPDHLREGAERRPHALALVDRIGSMTYAELDRAADSVAAFLASRGVGPGDAVGIQLPNTRSFAVVQQAAIRLGAAYVPLLPQLREGDLAYMLDVAKVSVLVVPTLWRNFDHREMAAALMKTLPGLRTVLVDGDVEPGSGLISLARIPPARFFGKPLDPNALRDILFTSGTEAQPKGVLHSYNTQCFGLHRQIAAFGLGPDDVVMAASPVGHVTGAVNGVETALMIGGKVVLLDIWNPGEALDLFERERVTMMWGAATFFTDLVREQRAKPRDISAFRLALTAGAPVPRELVTAVGEVLGGNLLAAFGQSEGQNIALSRPTDPIERIIGYDGRIHDGIDFRLRGEDGEDRTIGRGELIYRGPNLSLGYLERKHMAAAFESDGFIRSGDIGEVDADRYLRIVGRAKDIIIRGGENISPAEVEGLLFGHPAITAASVVGVPDERLGQHAVAVIVPAAGMKPTVADLTAWLAERNIAKFKWPEEVMLVDELPMTPSGKVRKDVLRTMLAERA